MFVREASITIDAPAARIYEYVSDLTRHPEWAAQSMQMRAEGNQAAHSTVKFGGISIKADVRIVETHPPTRISYESTDFNGKYRWTFELKSSGSGTQLTHRVERLSAPLFVRLIQPWLMWPLAGSPGCRQGLANLKRQMESRPSTSAAHANG